MFDVLDPESLDAADPAERGLPALLFLLPVSLVFIFVSFRAGLVVTAIGIVIIETVVRLRASRMWKGAESWPLTRSTVEFVDVREFHARRAHYHIGELAYSYKVKGEYYSGFCRCRFQTQSDATAFVEAFRGKQIPVRYKPEDPAISLMSNAELSTPPAVG